MKLVNFFENIVSKFSYENFKDILLKIEKIYEELIIICIHLLKFKNEFCSFKSYVKISSSVTFS